MPLSHSQHSFNLTDLDEHGTVYFDGELGGAAVSSDLRMVAYVAEKKRPKKAPYCKTANRGQGKDEEGGDSDVDKGEDFRLRDDLGEQMVGKSEPCVVVVHLEEGRFQVLDGEDLFGKGQEGRRLLPGQLRFRPGSSQLVGIAVEVGPYYLGLIYCSNRPCKLMVDFLRA